jgi:hypothetical protein
VLGFVLFLSILGGDVPAGSPATAGAVRPASESRAIVGEIVWVDVPSRLVMIRESVKTTRVKGQPPTHRMVALSVAPDVTITRGKTPVPLDTLKPRDHVTARYVAAAGGAKAVTFRVAEAEPRAATPTAAGGGPAGTN